jgi:hypothetical protein
MVADVLVPAKQIPSLSDAGTRQALEPATEFLAAIESLLPSLLKDFN